MPFTVSHALAVLPLATGRPGRRLVPAALVIGSMVPDLPYFVPPHRGWQWTHAASGPVTIDLLLGLLLFAGWRLLLRRPLVDLAPGWLAGRVHPPGQLHLPYWGWAAVSVVLGSITHVVWDTFTHRDRWGTNHIDVLGDPLGPLPLFKWFQFGSGLVGLLGLGLWAGLWLRHQDVRPARRTWSRWMRRLSWVLVVGTFLGAVMVVWLPALADGRGLDESVAFRVATRSMAAAVAAAVLVCLFWQLISPKEPSASSASPNVPAAG